MTTTTAPAPRFDGSDYKPSRDNPRLESQLDRIFTAMCQDRWWTLPELAVETGAPEASISAQLRHLRKPRFGAYTIQKRYVKDGLYKYRMDV